jgi:hypothetical protein
VNEKVPITAFGFAEPLTCVYLSVCAPAPVPTATVPVVAGIAFVETDGVIPAEAIEAAVLFVGLVVIDGVTTPTKSCWAVTVPVQVNVTDTTTGDPTVGVVVAPAALFTTTQA